MSSMPADLTQDACPASLQPSVNVVRRARTAALSIAPVMAALLPARRRAARSAWPLRSSAFEGMHAQYEHSPPTSSDSMIATRTPCWVA